MKKSVKWLIGILIGLIVVAVLVMAVFLVLHRWDRSERVAETYNSQPWYDGRGMPGREMPMNPYHERLVVRRSRLFPLVVFFGSLFCLGVLGVVLLGAITLVRGLIRPSQLTVAPVVASPPTPVPSPEATTAPSRHCPNCERSVQDEWSHCPHCGSALTGAK